MRCAPVVAVLLLGCKNDYELQAEPDTQLQHPSTDTGGPPVTVDTDLTVTDSGSGTALMQLPVAVCTVPVPVVMPPFQEAIFDGSASYDPEGHAITHWEWLAGDYTVWLEVTTDDGRVSLPVECLASAVPGDDLWVEMYWAHRHDDMDLHLLRPGGRFMQSPDDCYFGNTNPDWGRPVRRDDPKLDLDDIPGTGPENINIREPHETGAYRVIVHDWTGSNAHDFRGSNDVTVNIYIGGVLVWTDTRGVSGEHAKTKFAEINWPDRTVTPL
jgi:hypothetical protein